LLNGLNKLRNLKDYSTREDIFQNLTDTSSLAQLTEGHNATTSGDTGEEESK